MSMLNARFRRIIYGLVSGTVKTEEADNSAKEITGSRVQIPAKPGPPLAYRITLAGTNTGTSGSAQVLLVIGSTTVMTLTAAATTASDWMVEFIVLIKSTKAQRIAGKYIQNAEDTAVDYAAATVDLSAGADMYAQIKAGHASDSITCDMITIEGGE